MDRSAFKGRLETVKRRGNLRDADLARWLGRRHSTVKGWLEGRFPAGTPRELDDLTRSLGKLEKMIEAKRLPLPYMSAVARISHLDRLRQARGTA